MSDERETPVDPGAPVEEQSASDTAVQDAVGRATAIGDDTAVEMIPSAGASSGDASVHDDAETTAVAAGAEALAAQAHREQAASVDTQLDLETPGTVPPRIASVEELPSAAAVAAATPLGDVRDGEIRISADHPMAALYMQSPMPPELKGNRTGGVLIALLATLAFAVLYAGVISLMIAQQYPPSTFLTEGLLPWVTSWGFIAGVLGFFVGLVILVLIFGRAGWWAYVLFSIFVGAVVWGSSTAAFALMGSPLGTPAELAGAANVSFLSLAKQLAFAVPTLGAALLAREVAVWFGAWIGARGRRITAKNAEMLAEYDAALVEVRAK